MAQSGPGKVRGFDDFTGGVEAPVAETTAPPRAVGNGTFFLVGQGLADTDSGAVLQNQLSGVIALTATNEAEHALGLTTPVMFDVGLMGHLVAECRVQFDNLDTKEFFFGFSDVQTDLAILEGAIAHGTGTTFTLTASDICGIWLSSELTEDEMYHSVYNGGSTTGAVLSTTNELDVDAVAAEWDVLRVEIDPNGDARFYVNGDLRQSVAGAVSATVDLALSLIVEEKVTGNATVWVDYAKFETNRDWTR